MLKSQTPSTILKVAGFRCQALTRFQVSGVRCQQEDKCSVKSETCWSEAEIPSAATCQGVALAKTEAAAGNTETLLSTPILQHSSTPKHLLDWRTILLGRIFKLLTTHSGLRHGTFFRHGENGHSMVVACVFGRPLLHQDCRSLSAKFQIPLLKSI